ncbi:serine hydrolase domain-containing protein [Thermomonas alba]|uniref:serine hydrolase domain-containing protein n=1 Tax=Thermomonas alba TaxID=2888525 RepID=UPI001F037537|nr:serine hydrolase domain-containing protein [Thermomonas alba]
MKVRIRRQAWRVGLIAGLLPFALGSTAQDTAPMAGASTSRPAAASSATLPAALPEPAAAAPAASAPTFDASRFEAMAEALVANGRIPGLAMAIVKDGRVVSLRGYGVTDVRDPQPVDAHTVFRLASLSKSFAATLAGLLVNDGVLRWDSRLVDYLPSFRMSRPDAAARVTVADLLSHRTGLPRNAFDRDLEGNAQYHDLVLRIADAPMACAPGECYAYQNVAFSLIGDIVYAATGRFYSEEVARRIFQPLGMHDASYGLEGLESSARWARPHVRGRGGWVPLLPKPNYYRVAPAAGVNASISDLAQWLLAHGGHRPDVLPAPLLATLHAPLISTPSEIHGSSWRRARLQHANYALGWREYDYAGHPVIFHGGAVQGYRGMMALLPEQDFGVAILWNSESALPSGLLPTILDDVLGLPAGRWLDEDTLDGSEDLLYAQRAAPAAGNASRAQASPP